MRVDKKSLKILFALAWPAIAEQFLLTMVSYIDTAMVGALGAGATASIAINASTTWLINGVLTAIGVGFSVQVAFYVGAKDTDMVKRILRQAIITVVLFGLLMTGIGLLISGSLPRWMGAEPEILKDATAYIRIYMMSLLFQCASGVFFAILRCMGDTKTPMLLNTMTNVLNVILNFFFIFPTRNVNIFGYSCTIWGADWGVTGAALASTIAMTITGVSLMLLVFIRKGPYRISIRDSFKPSPEIMRRVISLSVPVMLERVIISGGQVYMTRLISSLGTVALAANHVAVTAEAISYMPATGLAYAATTLVGQSLGAKDEKKAQYYGKLSGWSGFFISGLMGAVLFVGAVPLASIFSDNREVIQMAAVMLRIVSISEPLFGISIVLSGALRGGGDTRYPFYVSLICMLGLRGVLAPIFIFVMHMNLEAIWIAMVIDLYARGILCALRFRSGQWKKMKN